MSSLDNAQFVSANLGILKHNSALIRSCLLGYNNFFYGIIFKLTVILYENTTETLSDSRQASGGLRLLFVMSSCVFYCILLLIYQNIKYIVVTFL